MRFLTTCALLLFLIPAASTAAQAGPYTDDLSKCLVDSTTPADRVALVKWMFTAASLHPAVQSIASVTEAQLDEANRSIADLFTRLLTEACPQQARKGFQYEGPIALHASFQVLGQVAGQELFSSPEVAAGMAGLEQHLSEEKLNSVLRAE